MARYDLHPEGDDLLLDVQEDILDSLNVRAVVPLMHPGRAPKPAGRLNPEFTVDGARYIMVTQYIGAVPETTLAPAVGSLEHEFDRITRALDMLFQGY